MENKNTFKAKHKKRKQETNKTTVKVDQIGHPRNPKGKLQTIQKFFKMKQQLGMIAYG